MTPGVIFERGQPGRLPPGSFSGFTLVEVLLAALITLAVAAGVALFGTRANNKLNQTATDVANPASLVNRFGS